MAGTNTIRQAIDQHSSHFLVVVFQVAGPCRHADRVQGTERGETSSSLI
jgi:hypothetical protein